MIATVDLFMSWNLPFLHTQHVMSNRSCRRLPYPHPHPHLALLTKLTQLLWPNQYRDKTPPDTEESLSGVVVILRPLPNQNQNQT